MTVFVKCKLIVVFGKLETRVYIFCTFDIIIDFFLYFCNNNACIYFLYFCNNNKDITYTWCLIRL